MDAKNVFPTKTNGHFRKVAIVDGHAF